MITGYGFTHTKFNFPCGDTHVKVTRNYQHLSDTVSVKFEYENDAEIIELLLLCDALKRVFKKPLDSLWIPYVPFSRQDRVINEGEPFSIKVFASLINSIGAKKVIVTDPHSDVTPALIENCEIVPQEFVFATTLAAKYKGRDYVLVAPDGGSLKKIYKVAKVVEPHSVVECSKSRNTRTGEVTGVTLPEFYAQDMDYVIVDDICDGGQTFIKIAERLRYRGTKRIVLMVTHGFFTKGLGVFDGLIDEIYTRKGKVK